MRIVMHDFSLRTALFSSRHGNVFDSSGQAVKPFPEASSEIRVKYPGSRIECALLIDPLLASRSLDSWRNFVKMDIR